MNLDKEFEILNLDLIKGRTSLPEGTISKNGLFKKQGKEWVPIKDSEKNKEEEINTKYIRKKYISSPLKEGDKLLYKYSNGVGRVKIGKLDNNVAQLLEGDYDIGLGDYKYSNKREIYDKISNLQIMKDKEDKDKFEIEENIKEKTFNILRDIDFDKIKESDLNNIQSQISLDSNLRKLEKVVNKFSTKDDSVPSGGFSGANSSSMRSSRSGNALSFDFNGVHHGGYYAGTKPYLVQIKVGGALSNEDQRAILNASKEILKKYTFKNEDKKFSEAYLHETSGTNWSSVMIVAPRTMEKHNILSHLK